MKIIIPILNFSKTGGNRVFANLASEWVMLGHEVIFIAPENNNPPNFPSKARIIWLNKKGQQIANNDEFIPKIIRRGVWSVTQNLISIMLGLRRYSKDADVIFIDSAITALSIALVKTSAAKIFYIQAYEPDYFDFKKTIKGKIQKLLSILAYRIPYEKIVNAPVYCNYKTLKSNRIIEPGMDYSIFYPLPNKLLFENEKPIVIGCIGRFEAYKGTKKTMEIFNHLISRKLNVKFKIAYGNLPLDCCIDPKYYEIVTPKNDKELGDFYRSLDILLVTAVGQAGAFHYPLMEAMACGVPVISSTHYLPSTQDSAWLINTAEPNKIYDVICDMKSSIDKTKIKLDVGLVAAKNYAWDKLAKNMLTMLLEIINEKNKNRKPTKK